jgi:hypothetical protein
MRSLLYTLIVIAFTTCISSCAEDPHTKRLESLKADLQKITPNGWTIKIVNNGVQLKRTEPLVLMETEAFQGFDSQASNANTENDTTIQVVVTVEYKEQSPFLAMLRLSRSMAVPPLDENNPENLVTLQAYLEREQYGEWPVLNGPYWNKNDSAQPVYQKAFVVKNNDREIRGYKTEQEATAFIAQFPDSSYTVEEKYFMAQDSGSNRMRHFSKHQISHMQNRYAMWNNFSDSIGTTRLPDSIQVERIEQFGVATDSAIVEWYNNKGRIKISLPGVKDRNRVKDILSDSFAAGNSNTMYQVRQAAVKNYYDSVGTTIFPRMYHTDTATITARQRYIQRATNTQTGGYKQWPGYSTDSTKSPLLGNWISGIDFINSGDYTTSLWDCGEFISTSNKLEVGHPPGFRASTEKYYYNITHNIPSGYSNKEKAAVGLPQLLRDIRNVIYKRRSAGN